MDPAPDATADEKKCEFSRKYTYLIFDYCDSFLKRNLDLVLESKFSNKTSCPGKIEDFDSNCCLTLRKMCEALSGSPLGSPYETVSSIFEDINLPTSASEISSRSKWASLSIDLLSMAFSENSELIKKRKRNEEGPPTFLVVPEWPQLPPFILRAPLSAGGRNSSTRAQQSRMIAGPMLPIPLLLALHCSRGGSSETSSTGWSSLPQLSQQSNDVPPMAEKVDMSGWSDGKKQHAELPVDDTGEAQPRIALGVGKPFLSYQIGSFKPHVHAMGSQMVSKVFDPNQKTSATGAEIFDGLCPINLQFNAPHQDLGPKHLAGLNILASMYSKEMEGCDLYQEFLSQCKFGKQTST